MTRYLNDQYTVSEVQLKMIELFPGDCAETITQIREQPYKKGEIPGGQQALPAQPENPAVDVMR